MFNSGLWSVIVLLLLIIAADSFNSIAFRYFFSPVLKIKAMPAPQVTFFLAPGQWLPLKCFFGSFAALKKPLSAIYARTPRTQGQDEFFKKF